MLKLTTLSNSTSIQKPGIQDHINIFYQFFIHSDPNRNHEIKTCLRKNIENPYITHIYLLNERVFTLRELGLTTATNKISQIVIGRRLKYSDVFMLTLM